MTTLIGIDAATKANNIGLARGHIVNNRVLVEEVSLGTEVESISKTVAGWISGPTVIAIDAPLGWPTPMSAALSGHHAGEHIALSGDEMFSRLTDRTVYQTLGKKPLDVGANLIARAALAALGLIQQIRDDTGLALPLLWDPSESGIIDVYPAATLRSRGLTSDGYKKKNDEGFTVRRRLLDGLLSEVELATDRGLVERTDHTLDAVLCMIAGADFVYGNVVKPTAKEMETARREGWIWFAPLAESTS